MNRRIFIFVIGLTILTPALFVFADVTGFTPLVPETPHIRYGATTNFVDLLQALIGVSVGIASVLAVVMVAIGGFQYMTTDSVFALSNARERIKDAIVGLLIVLLAVLVLKTINPKLVSLDVFKGADGAPATLAPSADAPSPAPSSARTACLAQCNQSNTVTQQCQSECKPSDILDGTCDKCGVVQNCTTVCP